MMIKVFTIAPWAISVQAFLNLIENCLLDNSNIGIYEIQENVLEEIVHCLLGRLIKVW